ncbi:YceI family protein [Tenacibaculum maritimum]|uniref:YceI family protein n=1 Tax=Tenacibaculum maritimum TaxID=107401 RepID=UPI0012E5D0DB|nr:YceI family protein [Tenacibaculum maritimum]CAA0188805.1 Probable lipoprotein precursor [Tenacibaculum maritimum]CAA0236547.1 Probable lipoprotein precursor [Tenacibaculum maritimum]
MKKSILTLTIVGLTLISCKNEKKEKLTVSKEVKVEKVAKPITNNIDTNTSVLTWKGTKPRGAHSGTVALKESFLVIDNGAVTSGEFIIDMSAIKNTDLDAEHGAKLVAHLSNGDFFDVEKYPTSKFVITSSDNKDGKLAITGNLTIKDVTKSITIPATISEKDGVVTFKSDLFNINRADFNVKYGSKSFFDNLKDKYIDDLIEFSFDIKVKK